MRQFLFVILFFLALGVNASISNSPSIRTNADGILIRNGKPYYFIGTNLWYGAILGSGCEGGNCRLCRELDLQKSIGFEHLWVLVGADGENGIKKRVEPSLQIALGRYNDTLFAGLDFFMNELRKRKMIAVLYLNNSWGWSRGYSAYLECGEYGKAVNPAINDWSVYMNYVKLFISSDSTKALFAEHVRNVVTRINRYNRIRYVDDPTILSWQIGNEPRAFSKENKELFNKSVSDIAALIKSLNSNHLVSSGRARAESGFAIDLEDLRVIGGSSKMMLGNETVFFTMCPDSYLLI